MTSFTFSAEEVRSAPPEVRRWIEGEVKRALVSQGLTDHAAAKSNAGTLRACTTEEATQIFQMISNNVLVSRVFFELARETPYLRDVPQLHVLNLGDMLRHVQLSDGKQLIEALNLINQALRHIRSDPEASLFGADENGHVFVHEATHRSIRQLWQRLVAPQTRAAAASPPATQAAATPSPTPAADFGALDDRIQIAPEHAFAPAPNT